MLHTSEQAQRDWNQNITSHIKLLKMQIDQITSNQEILKAWQKRDIPAVNALTQPVFDQLKREFGITHFYFIAPDRTCFLRVHDAGWRGDIINRHSLLAAQRTGEDAWSIDLGTKGSLTLRYVRPWKQNGKVIGYLELSIETAHLIRQLSLEMNLDLLIIVRKECTTQAKFEAGRQLFDFSGQWSAYPDFVVIHQTAQCTSAGMAAWIRQSIDKSAHRMDMGFLGSRPFSSWIRSTAFLRETRQPKPKSVSVGYAMTPSFCRSSAMRSRWRCWGVSG